MHKLETVHFSVFFKITKQLNCNARNYSLLRCINYFGHAPNISCEIKYLKLFLIKNEKWGKK